MIQTVLDDEKRGTGRNEGQGGEETRRKEGWGGRRDGEDLGSRDEEEEGQ